LPHARNFVFCYAFIAKVTRQEVGIMNIAGVRFGMLNWNKTKTSGNDKNGHKETVSSNTRPANETYEQKLARMMASGAVVAGNNNR